MRHIMVDKPRQNQCKEYGAQDGDNTFRTGRPGIRLPSQIRQRQKNPGNGMGGNGKSQSLNDMAEFVGSWVGRQRIEDRSRDKPRQKKREDCNDLAGSPVHQISISALPLQHSLAQVQQRPVAACVQVYAAAVLDDGIQVLAALQYADVGQRVGVED